MQRPKHCASALQLAPALSRQEPALGVVPARQRKLHWLPSQIGSARSGIVQLVQSCADAPHAVRQSASVSLVQPEAQQPSPVTHC
jgi:hypothetical protein